MLYEGAQEVDGEVVLWGAVDLPLDGGAKQSVQIGREVPRLMNELCCAALFHRRKLRHLRIVAVLQMPLPVHGLEIAHDVRMQQGDRRQHLIWRVCFRKVGLELGQLLLVGAGPQPRVMRLRAAQQGSPRIHRPGAHRPARPVRTGSNRPRGAPGRFLAPGAGANKRPTAKKKKTIKQLGYRCAPATTKYNIPGAII